VAAVGNGSIGVGNEANEGGIDFEDGDDVDENGDEGGNCRRHNILSFSILI
jgi:hypothetical protein